jgi:hypothetical protein
VAEAATRFVVVRPLTPATKGVYVDSTGKTARIAGVLFILTFVTSIPPALSLYLPC